MRDIAAPDLPPILVSIADPHLPESVRLVEHLWDELGELYGDTGPCRFSPDELVGEGTVFVVASVDGEAVGCGAVLPLEGDVGEVKRIFVEPRARRRGVAGQVLEALEDAARRLGYRALRLETGLHQPGAISLYDGSGWRRIARYGRHVDDPLSVCFEKQLDSFLTGIEEIAGSVEGPADLSCNPMHMDGFGQSRG
ncbi:MAG TPA: GNAT family N-acetyltransferase [Longimicrobiaceae bacterium]|nr:GNAT family N-acetyltransferase [Longimicrobiaceae bacterium]